MSLAGEAHEHPKSSSSRPAGGRRLLTVVLEVGGGAGVYFAGEREEAGLERVKELIEVLATNEGPQRNNSDAPR